MKIRTRIRFFGEFLPGFRLPSVPPSEFRPSGKTRPKSDLLACTSPRSGETGQLDQKAMHPKNLSEFHPPGKTLSDSNLLEIHNQDKLFLGNTFSTDPKSVHTQKPPLISTILAATTRIRHVLKKLLQAQNLPSPVSALFVYATQNRTPAQTLHANSYQNQKP